MILPAENNRTDPDGRPLVLCRNNDAFRHNPVWAVYKFHAACRSAASRHSGFVSMTRAKEAADNLNRTRTTGETDYFRVYRLADPFAFGLSFYSS